MPANTNVTEIEEAIVMDEDDYGSDDLIEAAVGDMPQAEPGSKTTGTKNFMGEDPGAEIVDTIEDLGVVVVDPEADGYIVRVSADVGPIYYGKEEIELKKNRRYRVPPHIYKYLADKDLLWEQQQ